MNILDAVKDLEAAAREVLETTQRRKAAIEHAEACLIAAARLREQLPQRSRQRFDELVNAIGAAIGYLK